MLRGGGVDGDDALTFRIQPRIQSHTPPFACYWSIHRHLILEELRGCSGSAVATYIFLPQYSGVGMRWELIGHSCTVMVEPPEPRPRSCGAALSIYVRAL